MHFLITGGCGFIGINLIKQLVSEGIHFIRVVDNLSVGTREDLGLVCQFVEGSSSYLNHLDRQSEAPSVELLVADILDDQLALKAAQNMDVIIHLAANTGVEPSVENPRLDCITNVIGTLNYLEAARHNQVKRFVFASSSAPIGECKPPIHEELAPHPVSPYGASKLGGEGYCSVYFRSFDIETVALRFGNVYGPGSGHKNSVVAKFIRQAVRGETLEIYSDGRQTRDFIYIDDLIRAIRLAIATNGIGGEIFQIASNEETPVGKLVDKLLPLLKDLGISEVKVRHVAPRLGDMRRNFSDTSKAKQMLGWQARVSLLEGLQRTVNSFECIETKEEGPR